MNGAVTFADFFRASTGHDPFPWQEEAAARMAAGTPPAVVSVPTGLGKTGLLVAWTWALAQCDPGPGRRVPLRLIHVSPRRVIVDDTSALAARIAARLTDPAGAGDPAGRAAAGWVADRLSRFTAGETTPLVAARLRGGMRPDLSWRARVDQPVIVAATADLAGSALLFRHWLASASARPVLAGLVGVDAGWVIDESHLQTPLVATVRRCRQAQPDSLGLPWWLVETTATPQVPAGEVLAISADDASHPAASRRLEVVRAVRVHDPVAAARTSARLAELAVTAGFQDATAVLVVANSVETARDTRRKIAAAAHNSETAGRVLVLHGQQRELERADVLARVKVGFAMDQPAPTGGPTWYLVATSAIEVGADLSADHLVTEACPLDSLIQRLGRLGRRADQTRYLCDLLPVERATGRRGGSQIASQSWWDRYRAQADVTVGRLSEAAGTAGAVELRTADPAWTQMPQLASPRPARAPLWSHGLAALVRTRPAPIDTPDVDALIHGLQDDQPSAYLAWRADLDLQTPPRWPDLVEQWPIRPHELVSVGMRTLTQWLQEPGHRAYLLWGDDQRATLVEGDDRVNVLRPGATVVVPSVYGGHDRFGFDPNATGEASDVADVATEHPKGPRLRLHRRLLSSSWERDINRIVAMTQDQEIPDDTITQALTDLLHQLGHAEDDGAWREPARQLVAHPAFDWELRDGGLAITARARSLEDDEDLCLLGPVSLDEHQADVADRALGMARRAGLADHLADAVAYAGLLHDAGKATDAFQRALTGGRQPEATVLLAKSGLARRRWRQAARDAGLPGGFRHEAVSDVLAEQLAGSLVGHLAGSSHGHGRPWFPPHQPTPLGAIEACLDGTRARVEGNPLQEAVADRLAQRFDQLNQRFGPWGLAWLEAATRLADQAASATPRRGVNPPTLTAPPPRQAAGKPAEPCVTLCLDAIPYRSAAGWLATLGAFGCYARLADGATVKLRWVDKPLGPVPELSGPFTAGQLLDEIVQHATTWAAAWDNPVWNQLSLSGDQISQLTDTTPTYPHHPGSPEALIGLFCRPQTQRGVVGLSELLGGVTSQVRLGKLAPQLARSVTVAELETTLFSGWRPQPTAKSLGLDWATISDAARAAGHPEGLPCRDFLALLGATWHPAAVRGHRLVWPVWDQSLTPPAVATLVTTPEVWATSGQTSQLPSAARILARRSVSRVMTATSVKRSMNPSSAYYLWEEAREITVRALQ